MKRTLRTIVIVLAASLVTLACGGDETPANESVSETARAPGEPAPSLAEWLPEGHPATSGAPNDVAAHGNALPPGHPPVEGYGGGDVAPANEGPAPGAIVGTVRETMDAAGYTYMQLETENGMVWVAGQQTTVAVGDRVEAAGSEMQNFRSNTLNRTFDRLILASSVRINPPPSN